MPIKSAVPAYKLGAHKFTSVPQISSTSSCMLSTTTFAIALACLCTMLLPGSYVSYSPSAQCSSMSCITVPRFAAVVVIRCASSLPTRFFQAASALRFSRGFVASRIVVTLGTGSPQGFSYRRLPSTL